MGDETVKYGGKIPVDAGPEPPMQPLQGEGILGGMGAGQVRLTPPHEDPWRHRSKGMQCTTCMWFVMKVPDGALMNPATTIGRCRRHAPTMSGYPVVFPTDWCGDHKLSEERNAIR